MSLRFPITFRPSAKTQRGIAAVELGLLLPLLILMLDGVVELAFVLHNQSVLVTATSTAARSGIVATSPKLNNLQIGTIARNYCIDNLIAFDPIQLPEVEVTQALDPVFQRPLRVTAMYTYRGFLASGFLSAFQLPPVLNATTVMYNE